MYILMLTILVLFLFIFIFYKELLFYLQDYHKFLRYLHCIKYKVIFLFGYLIFYVVRLSIWIVNLNKNSRINNAYYDIWIWRFVSFSWRNTCILLEPWNQCCYIFFNSIARIILGLNESTYLLWSTCVLHQWCPLLS